MHGICGIYILRNIINCKVYVGQSVDIISRNKYELAGIGINRYFKYDLEKYGRNSFTSEILEIIDYNDIEYMDEREAYWISKYKSTMCEFGYNILPYRIKPWMLECNNVVNKPERKRRSNYNRIEFLEDVNMGKRITISISNEDYNRISKVVGNDRYIKYSINVAINKWIEEQERRIAKREETLRILYPNW